MSGRAVLAVAVALVVAPALASADKAQRRDGGSGSSSGASSRQPSSSRSGSSSSRSDSSSRMTKTERSRSSSGARAGASNPPATAAQRRHPRPGTGTGELDVDYGYGYGYRPYYPYGYTYYYSPFYSPGYRYGYAYGPSYSYGYSSPAPVYTGPEDDGDLGSLRILVRPEKARVYVDGYYAGLVDDYDGIFQRLRLAPGPHDITFRLEGYRTQHFEVYVPFGGTVRLRHDMAKGAGEATSHEYSGRPAGYSRLEDEEEPAKEPDQD